jgi:hypothetical protein
MGMSVKKSAKQYLSDKTLGEMRRILRRPIRPAKKSRWRLLRASTRWQEWEIALLGTAEDSKIAQHVGRTRKAVQSKRLKLRINVQPIAPHWSSAEEALLEAATSDHEISRVIKRSPRAIKRRRLTRRILFRKGQAFRLWTRREISMLGKRRDIEVANRLRRSQRAISSKRRRLGIARRYLVPRWTRSEIALLGKLPDHKVARRIGRSTDQVGRERRLRGIPNTAGIHLRWTADEDKLLGTAPDKIFARKLGRTLKATTARREILRIPSALKPQRGWTRAEEKLLGLYSDRETATRLNRTEKSVMHHRQAMGIASFIRPRKRWSKKELRMIGTLPDAVLARRLGRGLPAIRSIRRLRGLPSYYLQKHLWTRSHPPLNFVPPLLSRRELWKRTIKIDSLPSLIACQMDNGKSVRLSLASKKNIITVLVI